MMVLLYKYIYIYKSFLVLFVTKWERYTCEIWVLLYIKMLWVLFVGWWYLLQRSGKLLENIPRVYMDVLAWGMWYLIVKLHLHTAPSPQILLNFFTISFSIFIENFLHSTFADLTDNQYPWREGCFVCQELSIQHFIWQIFNGIFDSLKAPAKLWVRVGAFTHYI